MAQFDDRNMMDDVQEDNEKTTKPLNNIKDNLQKKAANKIKNGNNNLRDKVKGQMKSKSPSAKNTPAPNNAVGKATSSGGGSAGGSAGGAAKAAKAGKAGANVGKAAAKTGKAAGAAGKAAVGAAKAAGEAIIATLPYSLIVLAVIIIVALIIWIFYAAMNGTLFNIVSKIHDGAINEVRELGKKFLPHAGEEEIADMKENDWRFKYNTLSAEQQYEYICNGNTSLEGSNEQKEGLVQYIEKGYLNAKIAYSNTLGNIQMYNDDIKEKIDGGAKIKSIEEYRLHSSAPTDQQLYNRSYKPYTNVDIAKGLMDSGLIEATSVDPEEDYTDEMRKEGITAPFSIVYFPDKDGSGTLTDSTELDGDPNVWFQCYNTSIAYKYAMQGGIFSAIAGDDTFDEGDLSTNAQAFIQGKMIKGENEEEGEYETSSFREWTRIVNERLNTDKNPDGDGTFNNTEDNFVNYTGENKEDYRNAGPRDYYYFFKTAVAYATIVEKSTESGENVQNENAYLANVAQYAKNVRDGKIIYRNPYINEINYFDYLLLYGNTGLNYEEQEGQGTTGGNGTENSERVLFDINSTSNARNTPRAEYNETEPRQNTIKERYLLNLDLTYLANYELLCPELNPDGKFAFAKNSQMMNTVNYLISGMDIATCNISPAWGYLDFLSKTIGHEDVFNASLRFTEQFKNNYISDNGQFGWFVKFVLEPKEIKDTEDRKPEQYPRLAYLLSDELELRHDVPVWNENASLADNDEGGPVHYRKVEDPTFPTGIDKPDFCEAYVWIESNEGGPEDVNDAGNAAPNKDGQDMYGDPIHESNLMGVLDMAGAEIVAMKGAFLGYDMYGIPCYQYYIKITDPIDTDRLLWSMLVSDAAKTMTYNGVWDTVTAAYQGSYYEAYQCFEPLSAATIRGEVSWLDSFASGISNFWSKLFGNGENATDDTLSMAKYADADQIRRYLYGLSPEEADDGIHLVTDASGKPLDDEHGEHYAVKDYFKALYEKGIANEFDKKLLYSDYMVDKNRDGKIDYQDYTGILNETYFSYTPRFLYQCDYLSDSYMGVESLRNCHNLYHDSYGLTEGEWQETCHNDKQIKCLYHQYNTGDGAENCAECLRLNGGLEAPADQLGGISAYRWAQDLPPTCPDCDAGEGTASYVQKAWSGRPKIEYVRNSEPEFCDIISISEEEYIKYIDNDAKPLSTPNEDIGYGLMELVGNKKVDLATNYNRQGYGYNPDASSDSEQGAVNNQNPGGNQSSGQITNPDGTIVDLGDKPEYNYYFSEYEWYAELGSDEKWIKLKDSGDDNGDGISEKMSLTGYVLEEKEEEIHPVTNSYDAWDTVVGANSTLPGEASSELVTHSTIKSLSDQFESRQRIAADYNRQKWIDYTKKKASSSSGSGSNESGGGSGSEEEESVRDYRAVSLLSALYHRKYTYDNLLNYDTYKSGYWDEGNGHEPAPAISREIAEYDDKGNVTGFHTAGGGSSEGRGDAFDDEFHNDDKGYEADEYGNLIKEGDGSFKKSDKDNTSFKDYNAEAAPDSDIEVEKTGDTKIETKDPKYKEERDYAELDEMHVDLTIGGYDYRINGNRIIGMLLSPESVFTFQPNGDGPTLEFSLRQMLDPDDPISELFDEEARNTLASLAANSLPHITYGYGVEKKIGTAESGTQSELTLIDYQMGKLLKDKDFNNKYLKPFWSKVKHDASFAGHKYKKIPMDRKYEDLHK